MKKIFTAGVFMLVLCQHSFSQTCTGLKIAGFRADVPDRIYFLATEAIPAGKVYYFTDKAWSSTNENFNTATGTQTWTAPAGGVTSGSLIIIEENATPTANIGTASGIPGLSSNGEQIYILSKSPSSTFNTILEENICFALNYGSDGDLPSTNAVDLRIPGAPTSADDVENGAFTGTGDITDPANWITDDDPANVPTPMTGPLPVTLTSFKVGTENAQNKLVWSTSSEVSNDYFEVERSSDAKVFKKLGSVDGNGDSKSDVTYRFTDETPGAGINYYRLKQVDHDGKFEYSRIAFANNDAGAQVTIKSNPVPKELQISGVSNTAKYKLLNMNGRTVKTGTIHPDSPVITYKNFIGGVYILQIQNDDLALTRKILID